MHKCTRICGATYLQGINRTSLLQQIIMSVICMAVRVLAHRFVGSYYKLRHSCGSTVVRESHRCALLTVGTILHAYFLSLFFFSYCSACEWRISPYNSWLIVRCQEVLGRFRTKNHII